MVKIPRFQCRGWIQSLDRELGSTGHVAWPRKYIYEKRPFLSYTNDNFMWFSHGHYSGCEYGRQNDGTYSPKRVCRLILETPEYVRLHGKWELALQMELQLLIR